MIILYKIKCRVGTYLLISSTEMMVIYLIYYMQYTHVISRQKNATEHRPSE